MSDFLELEQAIRRSTLLAAGVCAALLAITLASLGFAVATVSAAHDRAAHLPVLVVPGAVGGVYTPGLTEDSVRAAARYLVGLGTSFSGTRGFDERFDELERYVSPQYLPRFQAARAALRRDVETQNQARSFIATAASESLRQTVAGLFTYAVGGERTVYASGLPMETRQSTVTLRLQLGAPSIRNRAGVVLDDFEVSDATAATAASDGGHPPWQR